MMQTSQAILQPEPISTRRPAWISVLSPMDRDYHKLNSEIETIRPVKIGNNVWIGCRSLILGGDTVADGAVVAAGSVVTTNVPSRSLGGGNPARVVKERVYWLP